MKFNAEFYATQWIPKSLENHPIDRLLCDDILLKQYLEGNYLSANWLRENHNDKYYIIIKYLDESEGKKNWMNSLKNLIM